MPDAVVAGHISLDIFPRLLGPIALEPGRLAVVGPAEFSTGGAVSNTGLALSRLGIDVRLVGKVGEDLFGRAVLDALAAYDLAEDITVEASAVTSYTIVINPPGADRSFLHCPGANETFGEADVPDAALDGARIFHFGYPPLMPRMYADGGAQLGAMFERVRAAGVASSLDMCVPDPDHEAGAVDWTAVLERALPFVDVFAPSLDELLFMLDRGSRATVDLPLLAAIGRRLIEMGVAVAAIKLGDQGLYLRSSDDRARISRFTERLGIETDAWHDRELLSPCFVARAVAGTTGSGDATIAGLLAALLRGEGPVRAATAATAVGACSVEAVDPISGITAWPAIARRIQGGWGRCELTLELGAQRSADAAGTIVLR